MLRSFHNLRREIPAAGSSLLTNKEIENSIKYLSNSQQGTKIASNSAQEPRRRTKSLKDQLNVPFNRPSMRGSEINLIMEAIERGQLSGDGHFTKKCSELIQKLTDSKHCLLTHSCSAALEMAAILCNIKPGDEVIMPSYTFVSTANAVVLRGGTPVFVDIDPETLNMDYKEVLKALTPRTKAIFTVHYAGFFAEMDHLIDIAFDNNLVLVEDAAQALGSSYKGRLAGSFGDLAAFSFHETKNVISGEGGALAINNQSLLERAEIIRQKGTNRTDFLRGNTDKYTWLDIGSSFLPGELIAAFLYGQLQNHEIIKAERASIFDRYEEKLLQLKKLGKISLISRPENQQGNAHLFYILLNTREDRNNLIEHMRLNNINCPFHYVPLHSSPAGQIYGRSIGSMNITDDYASRIVRLPIHSDLLQVDVIDYVVEKIYEFFKV